MTLAVCGAVRGADPASFRLEFLHHADGVPVQLAATLDRAHPLSVTRLDYLLTGLALQRVDDTWLEFPDWAEYISHEKVRFFAQVDSLPAESFKAIRFRVGVDPARNRADPHILPATHPLHPEQCRLHWGWLGGYIFLALEGRRLRPGDSPENAGGYSFHIATDRNAMHVQLPASFEGGRPTTVQIAFDVGRVFAGHDFEHDGDTTHSRDGDTLAPRLKRSIEGAFRVAAVKTDLFQPVSRSMARPSPMRPGTTPLRVEISQRLPRLAFPMDNPPTVEGFALGRRLFEEPRLSKSNNQSCATCHRQSHAFGDAIPVSHGGEGQVGRRNAMPLFNLGWGRAFFWDGRAATLREQVLVPIQDPLEMNERLDNVVRKLSADSEYAAMFKRAFGSEGVSAERLALALEQFLFTLVSQDSKFDRAARGLDTLTPQEARGRDLFAMEHDPRLGLAGADCFHCHGGALFTSGEFTNNGLEPRGDTGRAAVTGIASDRGKFKTPSLRNVALTAPYMHDGRFATLEEVIDHYDHGIHQSPTLDPNIAKHPRTGLGLSAADKQALVAFLKTLTDESLFAPAPPPPSPGGTTPATGPAGK
jgi:cytochrome c peroxidase